MNNDDRATIGPTVDISLDAVCANFRLIRSAAPKAAVGAVLKCDAYGLGMAALGRALASREGCSTFFVAYPHEGAALRTALADSVSDATIYVFNGPDAASLDQFIQHRLTPVLNSAGQAALWAGAAAGAPAALHVDTGMNRLGAPPGEIAGIAAMADLNIDVVMSHLACSSTPDHPMNARQRRDFLGIADAFPHARRSLSASGGALMDPAYHFDLVRPGVALVGASPFDADDPRIAPVATLSAPVVQLRDVAAGDAVGYGGMFVATRPTRLACVALGYGDGLPRAASPKARAWFDGGTAPVAGRISMDLTVLDVTDMKNVVTIGSRMEFWGSNIRLHEAAETCGTISYELLTGLGGRVIRRYV